MSVKDLGLNDVRIEFQAEYALKSLNIKPDKISKLFSLEETKQLFIDFFDKADNRILVIAQPSGALNALVEFPGKPRGKACYFVKKNKESLGKDANLRNNLLYGDISYSPLEQLSAFVDEVSLPCISYATWPIVRISLTSKSCFSVWQNNRRKFDLTEQSQTWVLLPKNAFLPIHICPLSGPNVCIIHVCTQSLFPPYTFAPF